MHAMDNIVLEPQNSALMPTSNSVFGLSGVEHIQDFMSLLTGYTICAWQDLKWDPAVDDSTVYQFCDQLTNNTDMYESGVKKRAIVENILTVGGYGNMLDKLVNLMLNWIGWMQTTAVAPCSQSGQNQNECFTTVDKTLRAGRHQPKMALLAISILHCRQSPASTQGPSAPLVPSTSNGLPHARRHSPQTQLSLISRALDLNYASLICGSAFNITHPADTARINKYGGSSISHPRLATIGGEWDPRAPRAAAEPWPSSTTAEPVYLIPQAVHHWDENGLFPHETTATVSPE